MKKVKRSYMKKLCALILTLCMVFAQTQGIWAEELDAVNVTETTEASDIAGDTVADEAAAAGEAEASDMSGAADEVTAGDTAGAVDEAAGETAAAADEAAAVDVAGAADEVAAGETAEEITDPAKQVAEIVSEAALDAEEAGKRVFDTEHVDIVESTPTKGTYSYVFNGEYIKPVEKVYYTLSENSTSENSASDNSILLKEGTDYEVTYSNNKNLGTASYVIKGKGTYEGEIPGWFPIVPNPARVGVSVSGCIIEVKNDHPEGNLIYVLAVVSGNQTPSVIANAQGIPVSTNEILKLNSGYEIGEDGKPVKVKLKPETHYTVYAGWEPLIFLTPTMLEEAGVANLGDYTTGKSATVSTNLTDGSTIKFKASTQKNQSVKLSWSPDKGLGFKKYSLYRLKNGAEDINADASWDSVITDTTKKSYTDKQNIVSIGNNDARTGVYKLVAKDASGVEKGSYLMVAAPYLFKTESGTHKDEQDYFITAHEASDNLSYKLQVAEKNKETAYSDTERCSVVESLTLETQSYDVSKKLTVDCVTPVYSPKAGVLEIGKKYYFRTKSVFSYGNLTVTSAPSNAVSRKAGPPRGEVYFVKGLSIEEYLVKLEQDKEAQQKILSNEDFFLSGVHADSDGTCWKKGYVWFTLENMDSVKQIQLMRASSENGKYSSVRKYNTSELQHVDFTSEKIMKELGIPDKAYAEVLNELYKDLYCIEYNNFIPEMTYYYSVRAVSKTGNATGSYGPGYENTTIYEKVQELQAVDSGNESIYVVWKHDDCAKEYWIYRAENKEEFKNITSKTKPVKKVKGAKYEDLPYDVSGNTIRVNYVMDNTKSLKTGQEYYYMVRPVYKSNKQDYKTFGEWSAITDTPAKATIKASYVQTVSPTLYSLKQVQLKWSAAAKTDKGKSFDGYQIEVYDAATKAQLPECTRQVSKSSNKNAFNKRTLVVDVPKAGKDYNFIVRPMVGTVVGDEPNEKGEFQCPGAVFATSPLPVAELKVAKQTGSDFDNGAKISFKLNDKDAAYASGMSYEVRSDDGLFVKTDKLYANSKVTLPDSNHLERGDFRTYYVSVTYNGPEAEKEISSEISYKKYGKPDRVSGDDDVRLKEGDDETVTVIFKCGGSTATVQDCEVTSTDSDIADASRSVESGKVRVKIKGRKRGSCTIKVKGYRNGPTKSIHVKVEEKKSSSSSDK